MHTCACIGLPAMQLLLAIRKRSYLDLVVTCRAVACCRRYKRRRFNIRREINPRPTNFNFQIPTHRRLSFFEDAGTRSTFFEKKVEPKSFPRIYY